MKWHRYNGYAILVLIVFRLIWGFVGSSTSRWLSFVKWPWNAAGYAFDLMRNKDRHFLGHNPLGTYMVLALMAAVALQSSIGLFIVEHNDTTWGPLYKLASENTQKWLHKWHVWGFYYAIMPLIGLHILANSLYGIVKKDPLIRAMITGKKPASQYEDSNGAIIAHYVSSRAVSTFVIALVIVLGGLVLLGGKIFY
ncbi:MAG: cytochrome B [Hyphomicrobiaceae bacterium]|nr:cytochrome B [Hyphomicrobiaceae bacterium]